MSPALAVRGLTKSYGAQPVLAGVDLTVTDGVTAVLGASGCGKTTLLRLVAGFLTPDTGSIELAGRVVCDASTRVSARHRGIGYVPQEGALFPHLDVAANIAFGLGRTQRRSGAVVAELLDLVELPATTATRRPHELSGGQQQRVALARALAPEPALVLLDEPFSSLDAGLREDTGRAVVRALRAAGRAALLVTHDQAEALSLADQVAVMSGGRFLQVAGPTEVYATPTELAVATAIGRAFVVRATATGARATCALGEVEIVPGPDGEVTLAIRPEQVVVAPLESTGAAGVRAEVVETSPAGHEAVVRLRVEGLDTLVLARHPAADVPEPGAQVRISVTGAVAAFDVTGGQARGGRSR